MPRSAKFNITNRDYSKSEVLDYGLEVSSSLHPVFESMPTIVSGVVGGVLLGNMGVVIGCSVMTLLNVLENAKYKGEMRSFFDKNISDDEVFSGAEVVNFINELQYSSYAKGVLNELAAHGFKKVEAINLDTYKYSDYAVLNEHNELVETVDFATVDA